MELKNIITTITDGTLFAACLVLLFGSLYLTIKTRFVQIRFLPSLFRMLFTSLSREQKGEAQNTILPHRALFTAMSTTIGISTIVGPVIAIRLGGPGALLGFLITSFLGSAATYVEVNLSIRYRKKLENGAIMGGPMQYLKALFSPALAKWYAICCLLLMTVWSGAQANQLAAVMGSSWLGSFKMPAIASGIVLAILTMGTLLGGIRRIGAFSAKLVPVMFILYLGSCFWILGVNIDRLGEVFSLIFRSAVSPYAMATGTLVGGVVSALRWGIFKGVQCCEAGVGTQTIPHSMADTQDPKSQATLSMLSTYSAGGIAFLSGCVALLTNTWQDPTLPLGMGMVIASFQQYFSYAGALIIVISSFLFGFGTILGNAFNGSQCFGYLYENRKRTYYLVAMAGMIFLGAIGEVTTIWSLIDIVMACMALPHIAALVYCAHKMPHLLGIQKERLEEERSL